MRPGFLNQIGQEYNLYITRRIEPVYLSNNFYNKDIYGVHGEYLPDGYSSSNTETDSPVKNSSSFNLSDLLQKISKVNDQNCVLSQFNIEQTNAIGVIPFNFECECLETPQDLGINPAPPNGIIDIKNEINIQENVNDGTMSISKNIQVKAISINNSNPVDNAKQYARNLSGAINTWQLPNISNSSA